MDTSTISNKQAKRAMEWRERVARHAASGLEVTSFCARESISNANFYRWRALISDQPCVNAVAGPPSFIDLGAMRGGVNAPRAASRIRGN